MIAAVMLRHYKNYENVNFLPISDNVDCKYTVLMNIWINLLNRSMKQYLRWMNLIVFLQKKTIRRV